MPCKIEADSSPSNIIARTFNTLIPAAYACGGGGSPIPLTVISPNGGETFDTGEYVTIRWQPGTIGDSVIIESSRNDGATWEHEGYDANDGSFNWRPDQENPTTHARIRITLQGDQPLSDMSDADFTLVWPCDDANPIDRCQVFRWEGASWGADPDVRYQVNYAIDTTSIPAHLDAQQVTNAVDAAFAQWTDYTEYNIQFTNTGPVPGCAGSETDRVNCIAFMPRVPTDPEPAVAITRMATRTKSSQDGYRKTIFEIVEANIWFDNDLQDFFQAQSISNCTGADECKWKIANEGQAIGTNLDFKSILMHEIGHFLGLEHFDNAGRSKLTMFAPSGSIAPVVGQTYLQSLGKGDKIGAHCIYAEPTQIIPAPYSCKIGTNNNF